MKANIISWFAHAGITILCGLVGLLFGNVLVGLTFGVAFYLGREVAQHERKTKGCVARGFMFWDWSLDAKMDLLLPVLAAVLMLVIVDLT